MFGETLSKNAGLLSTAEKVLPFIFSSSNRFKLSKIRICKTVNSLNIFRKICFFVSSIFSFLIALIKAFAYKPTLSDSISVNAPFCALANKLAKFCAFLIFSAKDSFCSSIRLARVFIHSSCLVLADELKHSLAKVNNAVPIGDKTNGSPDKANTFTISFASFLSIKQLRQSVFQLVFNRLDFRQQFRGGTGRRIFVKIPRKRNFISDFCFAFVNPRIRRKG